MKKLYLIIAAVALACTSELNAAIITSGSFQVGSPTPNLSFTTDLTFNIYSSGNLGIIVFDEWIISDSESTYVPTVSGAISYQINGGPLTTLNLAGLVDNLSWPQISDVSMNDGYMVSDSGFFVSKGDVVTFKSAHFTFTPNSEFNSNVPSFFDGDVFVTDMNGVRLDSVPEPSSFAFGLIGLSLYVFRRRI